MYNEIELNSKFKRHNFGILGTPKYIVIPIGLNTDDVTFVTINLNFNTYNSWEKLDIKLQFYIYSHTIIQFVESFDTSFKNCSNIYISKIKNTKDLCLVLTNSFVDTDNVTRSVYCLTGYMDIYSRMRVIDSSKFANNVTFDTDEDLQAYIDYSSFKIDPTSANYLQSGRFIPSSTNLYLGRDSCVNIANCESYVEIFNLVNNYYYGKASIGTSENTKIKNVIPSVPATNAYITLFVIPICGHSMTNSYATKYSTYRFLAFPTLHPTYDSYYEMYVTYFQANNYIDSTGWYRMIARQEYYSTTSFVDILGAGNALGQALDALDITQYTSFSIQFVTLQYSSYKYPGVLSKESNDKWTFEYMLDLYIRRKFTYNGQSSSKKYTLLQN